MSLKDCTVQELKERLDQGSDLPVILDVREDHEVELVKIDGAIHVPMGDIPNRLMDLDEHAEEEVVVYCHHGIRSANVQNFLRQQGFTNVRNLIGGIDAYSIEADPSLPRY